MNKRHYEHTLPNIRGSLSNTYECSSKAIPLHRKKHVPTGRAVGEGISIQKENEGVKREICRWQVLKKTAGLHCMAQPGFGHCRTDVTYAVLTVIVTSFCR